MSPMILIFVCAICPFLMIFANFALSVLLPVAILSKVSDIKKEDMIGGISSKFVKTGKSIFNTLYLAMLSVSP